MTTYYSSFEQDPRQQLIDDDIDEKRDDSDDGIVLSSFSPDDCKYKSNHRRSSSSSKNSENNNKNSKGNNSNSDSSDGSGGFGRFFIRVAKQMDPSHCFSGCYSVCFDGTLPLTDDCNTIQTYNCGNDLYTVLPNLLKHIQNGRSKARTSALRELCHLTDRRNKHNRVSMVCSSTWKNVVIPLLVSCIQIDRSKDEDWSPCPDRKHACLVIGNLTIPVENKAVIVLGDETLRKGLFDALLEVIRANLPEYYICCVILMNLSYLEDAKPVMLRYVGGSDTCSIRNSNGENSNNSVKNSRKNDVKNHDIDNCNTDSNNDPNNCSIIIENKNNNDDYRLQGTTNNTTTTGTLATVTSAAKELEESFSLENPRYVVLPRNLNRQQNKNFGKISQVRTPPPPSQPDVFSKNKEEDEEDVEDVSLLSSLSFLENPNSLLRTIESMMISCEPFVANRQTRASGVAKNNNCTSVEREATRYAVGMFRNLVVTSSTSNVNHHLATKQKRRAACMILGKTQIPSLVLGYIRDSKKPVSGWTPWSLEDLSMLLLVGLTEHADCVPAILTMPPTNDGKYAEEYDDDGNENCERLRQCFHHVLGNGGIHSMRASTILCCAEEKKRTEIEKRRRRRIVQQQEKVNRSNSNKKITNTQGLAEVRSANNEGKKEVLITKSPDFSTIHFEV